MAAIKNFGSVIISFRTKYKSPSE